jgi:RNA polymerase II elongation factor ELL
MNSLKVPESGLQLEGPTGKDASLPSQAFALTLSDVLIEDMIKCVQNGDGVQLSLGASPTLLYGSKSHTIAPPSDSNPYDLYLTRPFESTRTAEKIPHTGTLFEKPKGVASKKSQASKADNTIDAKTAKSSKSAASSGLDSDIEALQNGLAAHAASREKSVSLASSFGLIILTFTQGHAWLTDYPRRKARSRPRPAKRLAPPLPDRFPNLQVRCH